MIASSPLRTFARRGLTLVTVALLPLFLGGWIYGPQSTFDTKGPVAKAQLDVFYVTLWVTTVIFILVGAVLAYATWKFKARPTDTDRGMPEQGHGNPLIELGLIAASVGALVIIAIPTLHHIWYTYDVPENEKANAYTINATGFQWWFKFEYPTEETDLGANGKGVLTTANELVIPAGRPVRVNLRTYDVIHSFWVPKLAGKVDMIPNRGNLLWMKADEPGYFWGQCAEYCGESHAVMRFRVIALAEKDFAEWLAKQKAGAAASPVATTTAAAPAPAKAQFASYTYQKPIRNTPGYTEEFDRDPFKAWANQQAVDETADPALIAKGRELFAAKTCVACHTIRGHHAGGAPFAPDLTHVGSRTTIAAGVLENSPANLHRWITDPDNVKPGNKMLRGVGGMMGYLRKDEKENWSPHISVNDDEARALVAYLHSLK